MISFIALLLEVIVLAVITSNGTWEVSNLVSSALILVFTPIFFVSVYRNRKLRGLYSASVCEGYLLRLFFLFFDIFGRKIYVIPNMAADAMVFYIEAKARAEDALLGLSSLRVARERYSYLMGDIFSVIGTNRMYGQFLCMLCSIITLIFFAYILIELDIDNHIKKSIFRIVCLLPNFAILSAAFLRESIVCMFITFSLYRFILWIKRKRHHYFLEAMILVLPGAMFHSGAIAALVSYIATLMIYDNKSQRIKVKFTNIVLMLVLFIASAFLLSNNSEQFLGKFGNLDSLNDIANTSDLGRTSYARYVGNSNNPVNLVIFTIPRLFFFLFSPMPWMWGNIGDLIAFFFSSLFYIITLWRVYRYLRSKEKKNIVLIYILLIIAMGMTFVFAWGTANAGTAARHRDKLVIIYGTLLALSTNSRSVQHRRA